MWTEPPAGWAAFPGDLPGVFLRTNSPRLAFIGVRAEADYRGVFWEQVGIHCDDLADIVEVVNPADSRPQPNELPIDKVTPELAKLLTQYANQLRVVYPGNKLHIRVPEKLQFSENQWRVLSRHIFTGRFGGDLAGTVTVRDDRHYFPEHHDLIKVPGSSVVEVAARFGIGQQEPSGYDGTNLLFASIRVENASKLSTLFPQTRQLAGQVLRVATEFRGLTQYPLDQAIQAGVLPGEGDLLVDDSVQRIFLSASQVNESKLKYPLLCRWKRRFHRAALVCPEPLIETFLMSATEAARKYRLSSSVEKYDVYIPDPETGKRIELSGTYYLGRDLTPLPHRDFKQERSARKDRLQRLIARFGPDLPVGHERYSDQDLDTYFEIRKLHACGEIIPASKHPLLPQRGFRSEPFLKWLEKTKPESVFKCPLTQNRYVRALSGIEELAVLPGFWKAVEETLGEGSWLRMLMISPEVRAAAIAHAI